MVYHLALLTTLERETASRLGCAFLDLEMKYTYVHSNLSIAADIAKLDGYTKLDIKWSLPSFRLIVL